mgnify:FL=1
MLEPVKEWLGVFALVISVGATLYAWLTSSSRVNAEHLKGMGERLEACKETIAALERRTQTVEQELRHLPAKDDVNELKLSLAKLEGTIGRLDESLSGVNRSVRRVEDYLSSSKEKG